MMNQVIRKLSIVLRICLMLILANCDLSPKKALLINPIDQSVIMEDEELLPKTSWKEFFISAELQNLIDFGLRNNSDLQIAILKIEQARNNYKLDRSMLLPNLDLVMQYKRQYISEAANVPAPAAASSKYLANLTSANFEIDLFGRIRNLSKAALYEYFSQIEIQEAAKITIITEIADNYFQILLDRKILEFAQKIVKNQLKFQDIFLKKSAYGLISKLELAQINSEIEVVKQMEISYRQVLALDENKLLLIIGCSDRKIIDDFQGKFGEVELSESFSSELPSKLLLRRPDVRQAEQNIKIANANIGSARAAFFPSITLTNSFGYASASFSQLFSNSGSGNWSFMPNLDLPIFQGGRNIFNLKNAKISQKISLNNYEQTIKNAFNEIAEELIVKNNLKDQICSQKEIVKATEEVSYLSYETYKKSLINLGDFLQAQNVFYKAQIDLLNLEKEKINNMINLYKSLGNV